MAEAPSMNLLVGLSATTPAFNFDRIISSVMGLATGIIESDTIPAARTIFGLIFMFQLVEAAAELSFNPSSCRLFHHGFWLRQIFVGGLIAGYTFVFVPTVAAIQPRAMMSFATGWYDMFHKEVKALSTSQDSMRENDALAREDADKAQPPEASGGFWASIRSIDIVAGVRYGIAWVVAMIAGAVITLLILMQGFYVLGSVMIVLVLGPICVAFGAHSKTEGIFWSFLKTYIVYGLVYTGVLVIACKFAGIVMAQIAVMAETANLAFGDGSDIIALLLSTVLGPLSAYTMVKTAPSAIQSLIGAAGIGESGGGPAVGTAVAAGKAVATKGASLAASFAKQGAQKAWGKVRNRGGGGIS